MKCKIANAIIGSGFIISSALLLSAKCISAALSAVMASWSKEEFTIALKFTPTVINVAIGVTFILGAIFIALSIIQGFSEKK